MLPTQSKPVIMVLTNFFISFTVFVLKASNQSYFYRKCLGNNRLFLFDDWTTIHISKSTHKSEFLTKKGYPDQIILEMTNKEKSDILTQRRFSKSDYKINALKVSTQSVKSTQSYPAFNFEPNWLYLGMERTSFCKIKNLNGKLRF